MKVIVQIPCLDEETTLPLVLATIPASIPGVDVIETLVIDDGSSDRTAEIERQFKGVVSRAYASATEGGV